MLAKLVSSINTSMIDSNRQPMYYLLIQPTVGIDFLAKNISHKAKNYRLQLWDTAGQERFRSLIPGYLRDSHCALIVYDVSSKTSFADIESWIKLYNESKSNEGFIFLVGNKIDREYREVTQQ
jgi:small GTP-binding protein